MHVSVYYPIKNNKEKEENTDSDYNMINLKNISDK
jgi:hypothetical protein